MQRSLLFIFGGIFLAGIVGLFVINGNANSNEKTATQNIQLHPTIAQGTPTTTDSGQNDNSTNTKTFTLEDVGKHDKRSDCWMVIDKKVYDITQFIPEHPGGNIIVQGCGSDATTMFEMQRKHQGGKAQSLLNNFYIGDLKI